MDGLVPKRVTEKIKLRKEIESSCEHVLNVVETIYRTVQLEPLSVISLESFREFKRVMKGIEQRCLNSEKVCEYVDWQRNKTSEMRNL